jgi:hypothetical protein
MKMFAYSALLGLMLCGCATKEQASNGGMTPAPEALTSIPELSNYALATPINVGRLTVVPVVSKDRDEQGKSEDYITLVEAKKNGWVEIVERPGAETVDTLVVRNTGPKPLLLMGGELLLGGKQDRIVAHDTIVPAGKEVEVRVYCVEHGRWSGESKSFKAEGLMAPQSVRESATYGDQAGVWKRVDEYNIKATGTNQLESRTVHLGLSDSDVAKKVEDGLAKLRESLKNTKNVVGIVVAIDGKVRTFELFGSPKLFESARDTLLRSFLAEAGAGEGTGKADVSLKECATFVADSLNARRRVRSVDGDFQRLDYNFNDSRGVEIATGGYGGKPAEAKDGFVHGTYSKGD